MVKKEIAKSLTTLKEMCLANNCNDCPLGFRMLVNYTVYYKCVLAYCRPSELQIVDYNDVWRATYQSKTLEEKYGKTDKGTGC